MTRSGAGVPVLTAVAVSMCLGPTACTPPDPAPRPGPASVLLISIDTLRADRLGAYGNPNGLTPNLDQFARQAVVFDGAYSQAAQTGPSHGSIFSGRYPPQQTTLADDTLLDPAHPTLAGMLGAYGYQTAAFVSGGELSPIRHLDPGFTTYESVVNFGSLFHTTPRALAWLDGVDPTRPWFLFIHGYDTHSTYLKPDPYGYLHADPHFDGPGQLAAQTMTERIVDGTLTPAIEPLRDLQVNLLRPWSPASRPARDEALAGQNGRLVVDDDDVHQIRGVYDGAVAYADAMFGALMAGLQRRGTLDHAVVIVMSDHGEQLGERGAFGHSYGLEDEETHTVLMVRLPRGEHGGRHISGLVEMLDILPTVADLVGAVPPAGIDGGSLYPALIGDPFDARPFVHSSGNHLQRTVSVRSEAGRLSWSGIWAGSPLFEPLLASARIAGPGFTSSPGLSVAEQEALRTELVRWGLSLDPPPEAVGAQPMPAELRKSMREHGYFEVAP